MPLDQVQIDIIRVQAIANPEATWTSELVLKLITRAERQREYLQQASEAVATLSEGLKQAVATVTA